MADTSVDWGKTAVFGGTGYGWLWGRKKNKQNNMITPPKYEGLRPYAGSEVGLGAPELKTIADQYRGQILERSQGKGLVGFDPEYRSTLENEFTQDLESEQDEYMRRLQAQSASMGQRGGIPLDLSIRAQKDYSRSRASGLADIKIADLEARRADINSATYAQPELVNLGSNIQNQRANFDLAEYQASMPTYIDQPQSNVLPALIGAAGTAAGAYFGGPLTAATIAGGFNQAQQKKPASTSDLLSYYGATRRY